MIQWEETVGGKDQWDGLWGAVGQWEEAGGTGTDANETERVARTCVSAITIIKGMWVGYNAPCITYGIK